jgi:hypothetical protein
MTQAILAAMRVSPPLAYTLLLCVAACGSESSEPPEEHTEEIAAGCGFPRPCRELTIDCGTSQDPAVCPEDYSPETRCALEQLAADGQFAARIDTTEYNMTDEQHFDVVFDGRGFAVRQRWDDGVPVGPPEKCILRMKEYYSLCLSAANSDPLHSSCKVALDWFADCEHVAGLECPTP